METVWLFPACLQVLYHKSHRRCETVCNIINSEVRTYVDVLMFITRTGYSQTSEESSPPLALSDRAVPGGCQLPGISWHPPAPYGYAQLLQQNILAIW